MYNRMKVRYPLYFKYFKCIGGICEDTCCKEWDIEIDKTTFDEYYNVPNIKINSLLKKNIKRNDNCTDYNLDYGIIKLNEKKQCPFLNKNKYCNIYIDLGEDYLSKVCTQFPRIINKVDKYYEISLDVACPEAAKLILLHKDKVVFEDNEREFDKYILNDEYNTNSKKIKKTPMKFIKEIRAISINIIQYKNYNIDLRLKALGQFLMETDYKFKYDYPEFQRVINEFNDTNILDLCKKDNGKINSEIWDYLLKNMININDFSEEAINTAFKNYADNIIMLTDDNKIKSFNINISKEVNANKFENIIKSYSYILENYLVNFMYNNLFPFSDSDSMIEGYVMLMLRYIFIKSCLKSIFISNKEIKENDIVKFITNFARTIEHDNNYLPNLLEQIEKQKSLFV